MNEKLVLSLTQAGQPLNIDQLEHVQFDVGGVVLNGERSAWPRGLRFAFDGVGATKNTLRTLRLQQGLPADQHTFNVALQNGALVFTTLKPHTLPQGVYAFSLRISDLVFTAPRVQLEWRNGETAKHVALAVQSEAQRLALQPSLQADTLLHALLATRTQLDGLAGTDWLAQPAPRSRRQACLLNVLAKLRALTVNGQSLVEEIEQIFFADVDRLYARVSVDFFNLVRALEADPAQPFRRDLGPLSATHLRLKRRLPSADQDATERYTFQSYRQDAAPSLQIVIAIPPDDRPRGFYADIDIDLGNPRRDAAGFVIHLGELLNPGQTDHLKLRRQLAQDPLVSRHLHYDVVRA